MNNARFSRARLQINSGRCWGGPAMHCDRDRSQSAFRCMSNLHACRNEIQTFVTYQNAEKLISEGFRYRFNVTEIYLNRPLFSEHSFKPASLVSAKLA